MMVDYDSEVLASKSSARAEIKEANVRIGKKLRALRESCGVTQMKLAAGLGVTFQQLQKYEKGENRISAGTLYMVSKKLNKPIDYFYNDMEIVLDDSEKKVQSLEDCLFEKELRLLNKNYSRISEPEMRKSIMLLVRQMSGQE